MQHSGVTCTCENFRRFAKCEDSELLGFICLGELGRPTAKSVVDFNDCNEGFDTVSKRLRKKVLNLVDAGAVHVAAPSQDPFKVLQDL